MLNANDIDMQHLEQRTDRDAGEQIAEH